MALSIIPTRVPLAMTYGASVAVSGGASLLYPVLPVLALDLQADEQQIGLVMAAFFAPAIVLAPIFGVIADLHGRRWIMIGGLALFGIAGAAVALAPSYAWVIALRVLQGVGMSAISPLTIVLISDLLPPERELQGQGLKVVFDRIGMVLLPLLGGALAALSWRYSLLPFLLTVPLAIAAFLWMPETTGRRPQGLRDYTRRTLQAIRAPRLTTAFFTGFLRFFLDTGLYTYLAVFLALRYGAAAATAGWLVAVSAAGSIATALTVGRLQRIAPERVLAAAFLASALALGLVAAAPPLWVMAAAVFVFGLANGLISPLQKSLLTQRTRPSLRGGVVSVDRVIQQIGKALAPVLMGLLLLAGPIEWVFWSLGAASAAGGLLLAIRRAQATGPVVAAGPEQ
jgi:MFS family permease